MIFCCCCLLMLYLGRLYIFRYCVCHMHTHKHTHTLARRHKDDCYAVKNRGRFQIVIIINNKCLRRWRLTSSHFFLFYSVFLWFFFICFIIFCYARNDDFEFWEEEEKEAHTHLHTNHYVCLIGARV